MRIFNQQITKLPPKKSRPWGLLSQLIQRCQSPLERPSQAKRRLNQQRLASLAEIETQPAAAQTGRVITLVAVLPGRTLDLAAYLLPWLRSVHQVGLRGTLLYAGECDTAVVRRLYPTIELIPVTIGTRHLFLERHFAIRDYLRQITDEFVCITDGVDVAFRRDPFEILREDPQRLYLGREDNLIGESRHTLKKMLDAYQNLYHQHQPVFNPGIIGGHRDRVLGLLNHLTTEIDSLDCRSVDCDMGIYNKVVHDHDSLDNIVTGEPLHSRFSHWEFTTPAAIMHK